MAKGKVPESAKLKAACESFCSLTEEEKILFRSKIFSKICHGLTKEQRDEVKTERKNLLMKIEKAKKVADQLQTVSSLSTETLKNILEERTKFGK